MPKAATPGPVPREALAYLDDKDLRVGFDHRDVWLDEHAHGFTVAKVTRLDLLDDIKGAVRSALADGKTLRTFSKELEPTLRKKGWWGEIEAVDPATGEPRLVQAGSPRRLKTIYRANLRAARAAGQWERAQRTKRVLPYFLYELGPSEQHRPEHAAWAAQPVILPIDHPWWGQHYPPNGWGCKCRLRQISAAEAQRRGGVRDGPATPMRDYTNPRTGRTYPVPKGVDPAWSSNPGAARTQVIMDRFMQATDTLEQRAAHGAVEQLMAGPVFNRFRLAVQRLLVDQVEPPRRQGLTDGGRIDARDAIARNLGEIPLAVIDRPLAAAIGAKFQTLRLSADNFEKQLRKRREVSASDYRAVQHMLDTGTVIRQAKGGLAVYERRAGQLWVAIIKVAEANDALQIPQRLYLTSYRRAGTDELVRDKATGTTVRAAKQ